MAKKVKDKLTPLQEQFCQLMAKSPSYQSENYIKAGYKASTPEAAYAGASRLLTVDKVKARITQLKALVRKRHNVTIDTIIDELMEDKEFARSLENPAVVMRATELKAKLFGLLDKASDASPAKVTIQLPDNVLGMIEETKKKLALVEGMTSGDVEKLVQLQGAEEIEGEVDDEND